MQWIDVACHHNTAMKHSFYMTLNNINLVQANYNYLNFCFSVIVVDMFTSIQLNTVEGLFELNMLFVLTSV